MKILKLELKIVFTLMKSYHSYGSAVNDFRD